MRNLVLFMHVSLDGYVASSNGEMKWIHLDDEIFDYVHQRIAQTNTALYGRRTWELMESYWPTAADKPGATKHDKDHAAWYKSAEKYVLSNTMSPIPNATVIGGALVPAINALKQTPGKEILLFGSPGAGHSLMQYNLIDEFWLLVNPVLVGSGIPLFKHAPHRKLELITSHPFKSGVVAMHYR
ncbi:MAG: dihydrofolate reductase [Chitinophaga sp.]|uniref:dihydrofolate reductase family protein n=1 Tax=Chitinophaga sp. TaxID=1869181 RepID=UPI0025C4F020|nr:dihydrofolate reductase family protein [Chitinophaga sp.]MBV8253083.1 dihydrofolate reductase [Chitinophaga sp.]